MVRHRQYRREEPPPPAFVMGFILGIAGVLRSVSLFNALLTPLQLLEEAMAIAAFIGVVTFVLRFAGYIERGNIYKAIDYTTQYMLAYVFDSILDGLFSFLGYFIGARIGLEIAKVITTLYGAG